MTDLERIAADIFARHGVDFAGARRAGGWTNATWLAGGLALRLATRPHGETIRREARLAALLPPETGYPVTVATGVAQGHEWCLSREIAAGSLGGAWPYLDDAARARALRELWDKAEAVHRVNPAAAAPLARRRAWFNSNDPQEADASLARQVQAELFSLPQAAALRALLARFWQALPAADCRLVHGDLTLDNALWDGQSVVSLLDFEFALLAPVQLDLNTLLKVAFGPQPAGPRVQQAALDLARPALAHPGSRDLLLGYAVLLELWLLETWLAHPEGEGPLETLEPYQRLLVLASGKKGIGRLGD